MANDHDFSTMKKIPPGFILDLVAFIVPFMLIFVSYFYIWFYMWKSRKYFKSHGTRYLYIYNYMEFSIHNSFYFEKII